MTKCNHVSPVSNIIHRSKMKMISRIQSHDRYNDSPSTKESGAQRRQLVLCLRIIMCGNQLLDGIFGIKLVRLRREVVVLEESAVVESSRVVEGYIVLKRVAN